MSRTETQTGRQRQLDIAQLREYARRIRVHSIRMTTAAQSGHPGGSLSVADIMAALFFYKMRYDPDKPKGADRDRFILSKGHCTPALYATLAEAGIIPKTELQGYRKINSLLQGHPDRKTPGVETVGGSLGQGFSVACGMALAGRLAGKKHKVYAVLGDGETQEGIVWETAAFASHHQLSNLVAIVDQNGCQNDGYVKDTLNIYPLADKFQAFGWEAMEIDGHDVAQLAKALDAADGMQKPVAIIARTVKGKGVSFMENDPQWHGKALSPEQLAKAMQELGEKA